MLDRDTRRRFRSRSVLAAMACSLSLGLGGSPSLAQSFDFWVKGPGYTASGEFAVTGAPGSYTITSIISGTITFGSGAQAMTLLGVNVFGGNDNKLLYPQNPEFDVAGISFSAGGLDYNLYSYSGQTYLCQCENLGDSHATITTSTTIIPAPGPTPGVGYLSYIALGLFLSSHARGWLVTALRSGMVRRSRRSPSTYARHPSLPCINH
jgi:hypothetical protein